MDLFDKSKFYVAIFEDVLVAVPIKAKNDLVSYLQKRVTTQWKDEAKRDFFKGIRIALDSLIALIKDK